MAPIKFEEKLKDKLEERTLQPSAGGWAKLSQRLDKQEKNNRKPWLGWLSIAAGLIIFLAIALRLFGTQDAENNTPVLVEEEVIESPIKTKDPIIESSDAIKLASEDNMVNEINNNDSAQEKKVIITNTPFTKKAIKSNEIIANVKTEEVLVNKESPKVNTDQLDMIKQSALDNEVFNEAITEAMDAFKAENKSVTDREVDSLLKVASKELFKDKLKKETSRTVDADALLQEVEEDMGQSFRSKVYEALKTSYETVKTAVAERNN